MIEPGNSATIAFTTDESATAAALGSGDLPVLATPKVVALVEEAAVAAIAQHLPADATSVGSRIELDHLAPTPIGGTVAATATVVSVKGRRIEFEALVTEGGKLVASAAHVRFIVTRDRFMDSMG